MRFNILIIFCFVVSTLSRPQQDEQSIGSEEAEYENYDAAGSEHIHHNANDGINQASKGEAQDEDAIRNQRLLDFNPNPYMQRSADHASHVGNFENVPDYKASVTKDEVTDDSITGDKDYTSLFKRNLALRYVGYSAEDQAGTPLLSNRDSNNYKVNIPQNDPFRDEGLYKRTIKSTSNEADLYETDRRNPLKLDTRKKGEYISESRDPNEHVHFLKKYYSIPTISRRRTNDRNINNVNRDRRQAEPNDDKVNANVSNKLSSISEDESNEKEEVAIRNHIKKLSNNEIQELLDSLSEDKRTLLKSIIDRDNANEIINKREINKKGEMIEENVFVENVQSDSSKAQVESSNINTESPASQNMETTESTKLSEHDLNETSSSKNTGNDLELSEKSEVPSSNENPDKIVAETNSNSYVSNALNKETVDSVFSKSENKRETGLDDLDHSNKCSDNTKSSDESIISNDFGPQDDLSQLLDEEYQLHFDSNDKKNKREINSDDKLDLTDDSIKSLEESFPNSNYDDTGPYPGSDMVPLIRVKRKNANLIMKKRAAGVMPDVNAAYVPYRGENDDEDNDEGNEFDDDGFYDRTSNYAKLNNKPLDDDLTEANERSKPNYERGLKTLSNKNIQIDRDDLVKVGSDTDNNVLSGVEGVDENLMFSSASRNRRTSGNDDNIQVEDFPSNMQEKQVINTPGKNILGSLIKAPNYQENDAFGPLPRNYEGELGRYKRIRHVKQLPDDENRPADNNNYLNNDK